MMTTTTTAEVVVASVMMAMMPFDLHRYHLCMVFVGRLEPFSLCPVWWSTHQFSIFTVSVHSLLAVYQLYLVNDGVDS